MSTMINSVALLLAFCSLITIVHGDIAFNKFVIHWPNAFCTQRGGRRCDMTKVPQEFKIHGLWPFDDKGNILPPCVTPYQFTKGELRREQKFFRALNEEWPSLYGQNMDFWSHEWIKHGSCTGKTPMEYFQTSLRLMTIFKLRIDLQNHLKKIGITPNDVRLYKPGVFPSHIFSKTALITETKCNIDVQGQSQLHEITFCISLSGNFFNCSVNRDGNYILHGCRFAGVRFTPSRHRHDEL